MATIEDSGYGHALGGLLGDINSSNSNLDDDGNVTQEGKEWLEQLLKTFGYNRAMLDVLPTQAYIELAKQIIEEHSGESVAPGLYEGYSAKSLLNDLPAFIISPYRSDDAPK